MSTQTRPEEYGALVRGTQRFFKRLTRPVVRRYVNRYAFVSAYPWRVRQLANMISVTRLFLSVGATWLMYMHPAYSWRIPLALGLMLLAASDGVDGAIARGLHTESTFGAAFDPIADKIMFFALAGFLIRHFLDESAGSSWLAPLQLLIGLTVFLELTTMALGLFLGKLKLRLGLQNRSSRYGKVKYVAQCLAVALGWLLAPNAVAMFVGSCFMVYALFATFISLVEYAWEYSRLKNRSA